MTGSKNYNMSFEEFQNRSRLYVIGALESDELEEFERARKEFGQKGEDFISECYGLHEALPDHSSLTRICQRWGAQRFKASNGGANLSGETKA